jgi:TonB family protein
VLDGEGVLVLRRAQRATAEAVVGEVRRLTTALSEARLVMLAATIVGLTGCSPLHPTVDLGPQMDCSLPVYLEHFRPPTLADDLVPDSLLDQPLRPRAITPLHYPPALRDAGIGGTVVIATVVGPNGDVAAAEVMSASHEGFADPAQQFTRGLRFAPPTSRGRPVWAFACRRITFEVR